MPLREIARRTGRNVSTISREKKRGTVQQIDTFRKPYTKYYPDVGARVYEENRENCGSHSTAMAAWEFIQFAEDKILVDKWSPDAVVGYAKRYNKFEYVPNTKTLYNWIDEGKSTVINMDLALKLRRSTEKAKSAENKKVLGTSIEERPESIETREEFGHWEIDTVLGHKSKDDALLTLVERKTRMEIIRRIPSKDASAVNVALRGVFSVYPKLQDAFKSITSDNGSEFSELAEQGKESQIDVYFTHPYHRGSVDQINATTGLFAGLSRKGSPSIPIRTNSSMTSKPG